MPSERTAAMLAANRDLTMVRKAEDGEAMLCDLLARVVREHPGLPAILQRLHCSRSRRARCPRAAPDTRLALPRWWERRARGRSLTVRTRA